LNYFWKFLGIFFHVSSRGFDSELTLIGLLNAFNARVQISWVIINTYLFWYINVTQISITFQFYSDVTNLKYAVMCWPELRSYHVILLIIGCLYGKIDIKLYFYTSGRMSRSFLSQCWNFELKDIMDIRYSTIFIIVIIIVVVFVVVFNHYLFIFFSICLN